MMGRQGVIWFLIPLFLSVACFAWAQNRSLYTDFALDLFPRIAKGRSENILVSPYSLALALSMAANGARGKTREAILETLGLSDFSVETLNQENGELMQTLEKIAQEDPGVEIKIAQAFFGRTGISFQESFLEKLDRFYHAEAWNFDFASPLALEVINQWVWKKTGEKIERILERLDPETVLILLNAVFFRGLWSVPFEEKNTKLMPFYLPDGSKRDHPIMFQSGWYQYFSHERFQAVSLPYGETGRIRMYLFLPHPEISLSAFLADLNAENWLSWKQSFARKRGTIGIPRLRLSYGTVDFRKALEAMGMGVAFSPLADFGDMLKEPAFIDHVFHRTMLEVNEKGTEGAAATAVVITKNAGSEERFTLIIDRPFLLAIAEEESGLILFIGAVFSPEG